MNTKHQHSLHEVHQSVDTTQHKPGWRRFLSFVGPAYLVSVGYMDPGNWATDLAGGSKYGYTLIWVLLMSNLMALLLQSLSARLGIVRGRDLAQANRESYPAGINFCLWLLAEIAIAATELAEVLGMAIGIQLLTGLPLIWAVAITVLDTFLLLYLQKLGIRKLEAFIMGLIGIIGFCFLVNIILAEPAISDILQGFIPSLPDAATLYKSKQIHAAIPTETALYLSIGIIGATVMPHNLYLHSALIQTRKIKKDEAGIKEAIKLSFWDSAIALNIAFLINAGILILAATVFFKTGRTDVGEIKTAHELLSPMLGSTIASTLFAVALIASGQSSTVTGTIAGQIVMEGYLKLRINPVVRRLGTRLVAVIPAIFIIGFLGEDKVNEMLIFSQVLLSLQLGFAVIPLIHFVSNKAQMGKFKIKLPTQIIAWLIAAILIYLNIKMVTEEAMGYFGTLGHWGIKLLIVVSAVGFLILLGYTLVFPILTSKQPRNRSIDLHKGLESLALLQAPVYHHIAIALDFSDRDSKLIAAAIGQSQKDTVFTLIHVVESATAILGVETDDFETNQDRDRLEKVALVLREKGYNAQIKLGYRRTAKEIARIVKETDADMLVVGAHGHTGFKDFIYGETVNAVRHELKVTILVVTL